MVNGKSIVVVEVNNVAVYPPVISLLDNMLQNGYKVVFIGNNTTALPNYINEHCDIQIIEIGESRRSKFIPRRLLDVYKYEKRVKEQVVEEMKTASILWTTSYNTVRVLGDLVTKYKNIMQFMELVDYGYKIKRYFKIPIDLYARKAWKVVVPEINRAYIQKTIWNLERLPYVLPNKPYRLDTEDISAEMVEPLNIIKDEKKKIVLYLGGLWPDRDLRPFAKAIREIGGYRLYIIGKAYGNESQRHLDDLIKNYDVKYLGSFVAPKHLEFVKYAHVGVLSYSPVKDSTPFLALNQLYCAPNKIYEYAAYRVPMIGNDILGLRIPFEQYHIGYTCNETDIQSVKQCLIRIDQEYEKMKKDCESFYQMLDLNKELKKILEED